MFIELVMPSNHLILAPFYSCPQFFPASRSFPVSPFFTSGGHSIGASVSVSVLPMNSQGWLPLGLTALISLKSKGLSLSLSLSEWHTALLIIDFLGGSMVKNPPAMQKLWETWVLSLGQEDPLEEEMASQSSIVAGIIPWTEELGGLHSMESQTVRHDWAHTHTVNYIYYVVHYIPSTYLSYIRQFVPLDCLQPVPPPHSSTLW